MKFNRGCQSIERDIREEVGYFGDDTSELFRLQRAVINAEVDKEYDCDRSAELKIQE